MGQFCKGDIFLLLSVCGYKERDHRRFPLSWFCLFSLSPSSSQNNCFLLLSPPSLLRCVSTGEEAGDSLAFSSFLKGIWISFLFLSRLLKVRSFKKMCWATTCCWDYPSLCLLCLLFWLWHLRIKYFMLRGSLRWIFMETFTNSTFMEEQGKIAFVIFKKNHENKKVSF